MIIDYYIQILPNTLTLINIELIYPVTDYVFTTFRHFPQIKNLPWRYMIMIWTSCWESEVRKFPSMTYRHLTSPTNA